MGTSEADVVMHVAEAAASTVQSSSVVTCDMAQEEVGGCSAEGAAEASPVKVQATTPQSSKKKQSDKKSKDSGSKKALQSPASSGLRCISSFLVPMVKKAKTDDGPLPKESAQDTDTHGKLDNMNVDKNDTAGLPHTSTAAQKLEASGLEPEVKLGTPQQPEKIVEVVDLVSPKGSPRKTKLLKENGDHSVQDKSPTEPVAKRQCVRYNESQVRKLEAMFVLGKDKVDFAAVAAELDGLDGGRAVTKNNVANWWTQKVKTQKSHMDLSVESSMTDKLADKDEMEEGKDDGDKEENSEITAVSSHVKEVTESAPALNGAEKDVRISTLREELAGLGRVKLSGDSIPSLRPSASDIISDFDLYAIRKDDVQTISMKTRQVMARFLEGSARSTMEVAVLLLGGAANKPSEDEESDCLVKIEQCINMVAHLVERRPKINVNEGRVQADGGVKKWEAKDMADIPERCRVLVDTHRKMEVALCERMKLIDALITELSSSKSKSTAKLDKNLLAIKDKYLKLEEKEKKEREKLEIKLEADRKKQDQRDEKDKEKERKKIEEKPVKVREGKADSKDASWEPKQSDRSESKPAGRGKSKPEPVKNTGASSIMSFFGKPVGVAMAKAASSPHDNIVEDKSGTVGAVQVVKAAQKERRNFHPWEKPKNALVACFPYGPGGQKKPVSQSASSADLASWLAVMRNETVRNARTRPLREDGTAHPRLKLIQLNMKIPLVKTQLVDVDVEAEKKIYWDVEWDEAEEKLNEIMAGAEQQPDGLFNYQGCLLEMKMEGGGWFDCRRPAYYGTNSKLSKVINARQPLVQDPELDYSYESDADWESEMGEGEDIGSDLEGDEEEEEDEEDGGFVVPDGYGSDDCEGEGANHKKRKLEQVVHYRELPAELAELLAVQVLDKLPLCLSSDPNVHLEENIDYVGEDIANIKAGSLEVAIQVMHKHPTAVAFTYILPECDHKLAGTVFLKVKKPTSEVKSEFLGAVSGYLQKVPESKSKALWKEMLTTPTDTSLQPAAKVESSKKAVEAAKIKISDAHLLAIVKLVHGSARSKNDLVQDLMQGQPDIPKSRAEKIIATVAQKKVEKGAPRWVLLEETLKRSAFIAEIAKEAWKTNTSAKQQGSKSAGEMEGRKGTLVVTAAVTAPTPSPVLVDGPSLNDNLE